MLEQSVVTKLTIKLFLNIKRMVLRQGDLQVEDEKVNESV